MITATVTRMPSVSTILHPLLTLFLLCLAPNTAHAAIANITLYYDTHCKQPGEVINPLLNNAGNCTSSLSASHFTGVTPTYLGVGCTRKAPG